MTNSEKYVNHEYVACENFTKLTDPCNQHPDLKAALILSPTGTIISHH